HLPLERLTRVEVAAVLPCRPFREERLDRLAREAREMVVVPRHAPDRHTDVGDRVSIGLELLALAVVGEVAGRHHDVGASAPHDPISSARYDDGTVTHTNSASARSGNAKDPSAAVRSTTNPSLTATPTIACPLARSITTPDGTLRSRLVSARRGCAARGEVRS